MELSEIRKMVEEDMPIDDTELDIESMKIPQLHNKYLNIFTDEKLLFRKIDGEFRQLKRLKWEYYTGKLDKDTLQELGWDQFQLKILKQDIGLYLESDDDLQKLANRAAYQSEKISYLESILKSINNRQWNIRNAIEWRKFISGQ